nr:MAG TPA: hypothetical protein [Caudoviricetes sp.]
MYNSSSVLKFIVFSLIYLSFHLNNITTFVVMLSRNIFIKIEKDSLNCPFYLLKKLFY